MPTDFSTIDLATLNAAQGVMVAALRDRCCQWEQDSADAACQQGQRRILCSIWSGTGCSPQLEQHQPHGGEAVRTAGALSVKPCPPAVSGWIPLPHSTHYPKQQWQTSILMPRSSSAFV